MRNSKRTGDNVSGVVLLAKTSGKTSFSSLSSIKKALNTSKVGHTGTLDSFADGLLVVLVGKLTRLVPHITNFDKTYLALIEFGSETDTLDPTGNIIKTGNVPSEDELRKVIPSFAGEMMQVPPLYSALHVNGKRASELAREGKTAELAARKIKIYSISLLDVFEKYALIEVKCSKGTYIRSLARDIAQKCGTCAHLKALRRTAVGPFSLESAAGFENLDDFTIEKLISNDKALEESPSEEKTEEKLRSDIQKKLLQMSPFLAEECGLTPVSLSSYFVDSYTNGKPLSLHAFSSDREIPDCGELAVFYPKGMFAGIVRKEGKKLSYGFVVPFKKSMQIFNWQQIINGDFPKEFLDFGTAISIGSFDGPHIGHDALFDAVISQRKNGLVPGVVTFTHSLRGLKDKDSYPGDVASLSQRIEILNQKGFAFAVIIDFSPEFGKIEGIDFLKILFDKCGMKYLAEGKDFHCGYKGACDMSAISSFAPQLGFSLETVDSVLYQNEKVSSSRIRKCVLSADFDDIKVMLDRPFALDCMNFDWTESCTDGKRTFSVKLNKNQLSPPDGTYKVRAIVRLTGQKSGEAQSVRAYRSDCMLEKGNLRLSFSDKLIGGFVQAIQFGYPEEIKL